MEESKEQTYEMLRRVAGDSSAVEPFDRLTIKLGCDIAYSYSGQSVVLRALADRIEAEQRAIAEAQGKGVHHIMKAYAEKAGMPMEEGETITEWLDRCFVPRPRFEDGAPVQFEDRCEYDGSRFVARKLVCYADGLTTVCDKSGNGHTYAPGERVRRAAPKVDDAEGEEVKAGDVVYLLGDARRLEVADPHAADDCGDPVVECVVLDDGRGAGDYPDADVVACKASELTHERPVLDADGVPIREGDTVYVAEEYRYRCDNAEYDGEGRFFGLAGYKTGQPITVSSMKDKDGYSQIYSSATNNCNCPSFALTHREPDGLEKLRDDIHKRIAAVPMSFLEGLFLQACEDRLAALIERGA